MATKLYLAEILLAYNIEFSWLHSGFSLLWFGWLLSSVGHSHSCDFLGLLRFVSIAWAFYRMYTHGKWHIEQSGLVRFGIIVMAQIYVAAK